MSEPITIERQIAAVRHEISMRNRVYPRWVAAGKMTQAKADEVITALVSALPGLPLTLLQTTVSPQTAMTQWLVAESPQDWPPRLSVEQGARRLTFRLHQQTGDSEGGGDWLIVMREVSDDKIIESMSLAFKLTAREAEVLYWVVQGKTNRDIGEILGTSPRTVHKHLEHVFGKLGVETRTAAAGLAVRRVKQLVAGR